ncbi:MAG: hypothetical protein ABWK01_04525, partial [Infirmifilum sp.]
VRVTGLQPGWTVELWNGSKLVASAVADAGGAASLNVLQLPIIRGATIVVKDSAGQIIISKTLDVVVGGDTYKYV